MHRCDARSFLVAAAALLLGQAQSATPLTPHGASADSPYQAPAKTAYRCTSAQGAVSYSQRPCEAGAPGQRIDAKDDRTEAQRQQAQANLQRDQALASEAIRKPHQGADHATQTGPANLSGHVRQVAVGQREVDRRGATVETLRRNPHHFRAKAPRKMTQKTASTASSPS